MKILIPLFVLLVSFGCADREHTLLNEDGDYETGATATATQTTPAGRETVGGEQQARTWPMNATIVSRDAEKNTVNLDNEDVPGVMAPMEMDYELRGASVDSLPPDGTQVQVTLHEQDGTYWVTDVKSRS